MASFSVSSVVEAIADQDLAASEEAMMVVRDLGDHALSSVLRLVDISGLFLRELTALEISGLCCLFPKVREWFLENHAEIGTLPTTLDVTNLFKCVPRSDALKPLLTSFEPHSVVIRFIQNMPTPHDVLKAFDVKKSFYSLELIFDRSNVLLLPGAYSVRRLSIVQNRWNPSPAAAQIALSGIYEVKEIILTYGCFDVVMAAHLEHKAFTHFELREASPSQFEVPQIVTWLVSRKALTHLTIVHWPCWEYPCNEVRFMRLLLLRIPALRNLCGFEFSIGGRYTSLRGLLQLQKLKTLRINIEIHLEFGLQAHIQSILRSLTVESVTIGFYCSRDRSCIRRQESGRNYISHLQEKFPSFEYLALQGLSADDLLRV